MTRARAGVLALAAVSGCGHAPEAAPGTPAPLTPAPMMVAPSAAEAEASLDPPLLFHLALDADRAGDTARARGLYERLLAAHPDSELGAAARFNLALIAETAHAFDVAALRYTEIGATPAPAADRDRRTWIDANFRLGVVLSKLEDWWRAVAAFDRILEAPWIGSDDRLEALVGRGIALKQAGDSEAASLTFAHALSVYRRASADGPFEDRGLAAEAAYWAGEIKAERYEAVRLELPESVLKERLDAKCQLLLEAQALFLHAIRLGDSHTAAVAGLRVGGLYESLYGMIVSLEVPTDLNPEEAAVYTDEVKGKVMILVRKALVVYERSLQAGRRAPSAAPWVARLEEAVSRLRTVYLMKEGGT
ncbi:MAG: tetratricopeptide repeat protein [Deltaproteobacteria bacterium]|nr:tetratricopeptide repeat protein [Deltaproteobacteria bacterium]